MAPSRKTEPETSKKGRTSSKLFVPACYSFGFLLVCLIAFLLQIVYFSPISPVLDEVPQPAVLSATQLQDFIKVGEGSVNHPEDASMDKNGVIYTATRDGWIKRLQDGTWGLHKVSEDGVENFLSYVNGSKLRFANDVVEASDGSLYFTVSSSKYLPHEYCLDILEGKPHGQLLKYDPSSNITTLVADGFYFANGVALSRDEDYVVVCESWKCRKYWLKGERKGKLETFAENLPGAPDNINLAPDGTFWIAIIKLDARRMKVLNSSKLIKHVLAAYPKLFSRFITLGGGAHLINVAEDGTIIRNLVDPTGQLMSFVTSGLQVDDHLYMISLTSNFIGKVQLS
ncbi:Str synth domain-containing protein [Citrus sinensis]|uniref:Str synth domain-containing protein n=1 Tax=Citrus sinensis TaxID=2711 RepID=A0ACB8P2W6_CITSI|nr:Str synth domain-containing protein [Citrus sinensis]